MQTVRLGSSEINVSRLGYGCMRIAGDGSGSDLRKGTNAVRAAVDAGYTLFDHADIYANGACEWLFGEVLRASPGLRDRLTILSKCGIRTGDPKHYDASRSYLMSCVESTLRRLGIETLDVLLLHRPDFLMDLHDVAAAFERLQSDGKVLEFGVSNFSAGKFRALQSVAPMPLQVNQVEFNIHNVDPLHDGMLDLAQAERVTVQAWCPLAGIVWDAWGNTFSDQQTSRIRAEAARQAEHYGVMSWQIALAWIMKHPTGVCPIVGSTTPDRIAAATAAVEIPYTRADWYRLLEARDGAPVP